MMKKKEKKKERKQTNATDAQTKKNYNRGTALDGWKKYYSGLKPVLFTRNLTLNSDAAPNYKH